LTIAGCGWAAAADIAMESPDWTGLYLGVYGGGGAIVNNIEIPPAGGANINGLGGEGVLGGVMAGYNYQMNNIVLGLQGEVGFNDLKSEANLGGFNAEAKQNFVAALSARAGLLVTPDTLAYIIGGYSHSNYKLTTNVGFSAHENYDGFHVGGGLETKITSNATLRAEYRYTSYSGEDWGSGGVLNIEPSSHTGTIGLAWLF
jgi:outer membrane immunogenic protein